MSHRLSGYLSILFLFFAFHLSGQNTLVPDHARLISISRTASMGQGAVALFANPASALLYDHKQDFSISGINRYTTDIFTLSAAASIKLPTNDGLGIILGSYGIQGFKQNSLLLSYSKKIGSDAFLAIQPSYQRLDIEELGQTSYWDLTLGYFQEFNFGGSLSIHSRSLRTFISKNNDQLGEFQISAKYPLSEISEIYSGITYYSDGTWSLSPGVLYRPHEVLDVYISVSTLPSSIAFGTSVKIQDQMTVDIAYRAHPDLGASLGLSFGYRIR